MFLESRLGLLHFFLEKMNITDWVIDKAIRMYPLPDILRSHMYYTTCLQCIHDAAGPRITFCFCFFFGKGEMKIVWTRGLKNVFLRFPMQLLGSKGYKGVRLIGSPSKLFLG